MNEIIEITDLKDMLNKTGKLYNDLPAYKIKQESKKGKTYKIITHKQVRDTINALGTALIDLGLKGKRIAVIGKNRYEWEIAYLAVVCGVGTVVPIDKSLPENEMRRVLERSKAEAIFYTQEYEESLLNMVYHGVGKLKHCISMDTDFHRKGIYSQKELIEVGTELIKQGNTEFIDAQIDPEETSMMLFTSGTTSESKVVELCHKNICANLMDLAQILDIGTDDRVLSFLPLHHVFECTVGFLFSLYRGCQTSFCDGIRHIPENFREYQITFAAFVPAIFESLHENIIKKLQKDGKWEKTQELMQEYKYACMEEKRRVFPEIQEFFGGHTHMLISGAAALDPQVEEDFRAWGINLCQGYGLTETSPVIGVETETDFRVGSIGRALPHVRVKLEDVNDEGIGELVVKGPSIMKGYYQNKEATKDVLQHGWFYTGDLAKIDKDGYIFICGRKKSVIVLKNGKNIFPEEMENLVNRIEGVKESFIYGRPNTEDQNDIKIYVKIVYDEDVVKNTYKVQTEQEIEVAIKNKIKEINKTMPSYKAIRGVVLTTTPLIRTTTSKIKRQEEIKTVV